MIIILHGLMSSLDCESRGQAFNEFYTYGEMHAWYYRKFFPLLPRFRSYA